MSTAVPPMPSEAAPAGLSEPQRIVNTFVAPSKTFVDIHRNASWWVPWLLIGIISVVDVSLMTKKINWEQMVRQQIENSSRAQVFDSLPKEQQDRQIAIAAKIGRTIAYLSPVLTLIFALIVAAILMATFNFGFEAEVPFGAAMAIVFYSWLPRIIEGVLVLITLLVRSDFEGLDPRNMVATNLAYFMDPTSGSRFLYGMAASVDVFAIWSIVLMGIGFSVNSANHKLKPGTAISTIVVLYVLYRLAVSGAGFV